MEQERIKISDLKEGDNVIVSGRYDTTVGKIERVTKTQVIVRNRRFNRATGRAVGSGNYSSTSIRVASESDIKKVEQAVHHRQLANKISETYWMKIPTEVLEKINATLTTPASDE